MFYPYEGYRSVTPLDAARVNRTIFHHHSVHWYYITLIKGRDDITHDINIRHGKQNPRTKAVVWKVLVPYVVGVATHVHPLCYLLCYHRYPQVLVRVICTTTPGTCVLHNYQLQQCLVPGMAVAKLKSWNVVVVVVVVVVLRLNRFFYRLQYSHSQCPSWLSGCFRGIWLG